MVVGKDKLWMVSYFPTKLLGHVQRNAKLGETSFNGTRKQWNWFDTKSA